MTDGVAQDDKDSLNGMIRMRLRVLMYPTFIMLLARLGQITGVDSKEAVKEAMKHKQSKKIITEVAHELVQNPNQDNFMTNLCDILDDMYPDLVAQAKAEISKAPSEAKRLNPKYKFVEDYFPQRHAAFWNNRQVPREDFFGEGNMDNDLQTGVGETIDWNYKKPPVYAELPGDKYYVEDVLPGYKPLTHKYRGHVEEE
jgi:hypothetical protein